jgi:hypothetical protein
MKILSAKYTFSVSKDEIQAVKDRNPGDKRTNKEVASLIAQNKIWTASHFCIQSYKMNLIDVEDDVVASGYIVTIGIQNASLKEKI